MIGKTQQVPTETTVKDRIVERSDELLKSLLGIEDLPPPVAVSIFDLQGYRIPYHSMSYFQLCSRTKCTHFSISQLQFLLDKLFVEEDVLFPIDRGAKYILICEWNSSYVIRIEYRDGWRFSSEKTANIRLFPRDEIYIHL